MAADHLNLVQTNLRLCARAHGKKQHGSVKLWSFKASHSVVFDHLRSFKAPHDDDRDTDYDQNSCHDLGDRRRLHVYAPILVLITPTNSSTAAALLASIAFSSSVSLIS